jgi:hypothetical protein
MRLIKLMLLAGLLAAAHPYYIMNAPLDEYTRPVEAAADMLPDEYREILSVYRNGNYRLCILKLQDLLALGLPDGRLDHYLLMVGECYHQLKLDKFANDHYIRLANAYPQSPFFGFAAYRLQEDAYFREDATAAQNYHKTLQQRFRAEPVGFASVFIEGKRLYKTARLAEADSVLARVPGKSDLIYPATFIRSLISVSQNDIEKAVLQLDVVIKHTDNALLRDEALIVLSELYHKLDRDTVAISLLQKIPVESEKYGHAQLLLSQFYMAMGDHENAVAAGERLLPLADATFMFEAALVLEPTYIKLKKSDQIVALREFLEVTVKKKRLIFDIYRELDLLTEMESSFIHFYQEVSERLVSLADKRHAAAIFVEASNGIKDLKARHAALLKTLDPKGRVLGSSGFNEIRYIEHLDATIQRLTRRADSLYKAITLTGAKKDTAHARAERALISQRAAVLDSLRGAKETKEDIRKFCLGRNVVVRENEDLQAKFVDWNMLRLENYKNRLRSIYQTLSDLQKKRKEKDGGTKKP